MHQFSFQFAFVIYSELIELSYSIMDGKIVYVNCVVTFYELKNWKVIIFSCVTGASSGIGADICVELAKNGSIVIGLARRVDKITELNERFD